MATTKDNAARTKTQGKLQSFHAQMHSRFGQLDLHMSPRTGVSVCYVSLYKSVSIHMFNCISTFSLA